MITITKTELPGVIILKNREFIDDRGFFMETFNQQRFAELGLQATFVQDNQSRSSKNVIRGLHYQFPQWQGKLMRVLRGAIYDVAVDIRPDSPTFKKWVGVELNDENRLQLYIPPGFAHGFATLSDIADISYKCTTSYNAQDDAGILWNDPEIGINWPIDQPLISEKDAKAPKLSALEMSKFKASDV